MYVMSYRRMETVNFRARQIVHFLTYIHEAICNVQHQSLALFIYNYQRIQIENRIDYFGGLALGTNNLPYLDEKTVLFCKCKIIETHAIVLGLIQCYA